MPCSGERISSSLFLLQNAILKDWQKQVGTLKPHLNCLIFDNNAMLSHPTKLWVDGWSSLLTKLFNRGFSSLCFMLGWWPTEGGGWGVIRLGRERFRSMQQSRHELPLAAAWRRSSPGSLVKIISRGCLPVFFHSISFDLKSPNWIRIDWPAGWMRADHTDREGKHPHNSCWR